jgi:surface protein
MFYEAVEFNKPIGNWNVSKVTTMAEMFSRADVFNQPIENWDVSNVRDMEGMFCEAYRFNKPIGNWNVSNVTNMNSMFSFAESFNQPIGNWDVSKVTDMSWMFSGADKFNQPIGDWNVSNVTDMNRMFADAVKFNQSIGNWDVSKVTDMTMMFSGAESFNQPIGNWDVSNVKDCDDMFSGAKSFNQTKPLDGDKGTTHEPKGFSGKTGIDIEGIINIDGEYEEFLGKEESGEIEGEVYGTPVITVSVDDKYPITQKIREEFIDKKNYGKSDVVDVFEEEDDEGNPAFNFCFEALNKIEREYNDDDLDNYKNKVIELIRSTIQL